MAIRPVSKPPIITPGCTAGRGAGEVGKAFEEYCKMLLHNTTLEAQELQLPNATFSPLPPVLSTAPAKARAQLPRKATAAQRVSTEQ